MTRESRALAPRKPTARSRVSNGRDILPNVDGRSLVARRYRDISGQILAEQGGADVCSEARQQLIRRFAAAACLAEQLESRLANGEQINIAEHASLSSTLVRLASRIGIERIPRDLTPTLAEYLAQKTASEAQDVFEDEADGHASAEGTPTSDSPRPSPEASP